MSPKAQSKTKEAGKAKETKTKAPDSFTVKIPNELDDATLIKLNQLVSSKQTLLKKALGAKDLPINKVKDCLEFPWFTLHGITGEAEAYAQLITAMIEMSENARWINPEDKPTDNERFTMRIFTVRLGLKGDKYRLIRKLLTQNLSGNSAWRDGAPPKKVAKKDGNKSSSPSTKGGSTL